MCGIGGLLHTPHAPATAPACLEQMALALRHRGPDGSHVAHLDQAELLHTRLSIIDLAGGDQPLYAGSGTLVANGELYNDPAIRQALGPEAFKTGSDCESALALWQRHGPDFPRHLRGMYATALYDSSSKTALLSRDPFGIKPLYYTSSANGVAFASEPSALLAAGLAPRAIDPARREELLQLQFTTGAQSIFPTIRRLLPGETLCITQGQITQRHTLSALPQPDKVALLTSETEALNRLDAALMDSIAVHERADVPFGLFLSGGIDSACLLTAMSRQPRTAPLRSWTATFDAPGAANEAEAAQALAHAAGTEHETLHITRAMVWQHLPAIVASMDDPAADYAIIPTWLLARKAAADVRVVLSGEGGDELFCGYGRYRAATRPWWRGRKKPWRRGIFDGLDILRHPTRHWRDGIAQAEATYHAHGTPLARVQAVDTAEWLPNDLLLKLDRCLMAHGLEGRTPLLDPVVADVACRLPDTLRVRGGKGKWLLRQWLAQHNPAAQPFAPKQGFTVPIGAWMAQDSHRLADLLAGQDCIAEIARPDRVRALLRDIRGTREAAAAWNLLFYALWHRAHIRALPPEGDVFEALSLQG